MNKPAALLAASFAIATPQTADAILMDTGPYSDLCVMSASLPNKYDCRPELVDRDSRRAADIANQLADSIRDCSGVSVAPREQQMPWPFQHLSVTPESIQDEACLEATIQNLREKLPLITLACLVSSFPDMESDDERARTVEVDCSIETK